MNMNTTPPTVPLRRRLSELRRRIRLLDLTRSVCLFILTAGGLIAGVFFLDWLFELPWGVRATLLALSIGIMAWGAVRHFILPSKKRLDDETLALLVERTHPELNSSLISALQFERQIQDPSNTESPELMRSAIDDAVSRFSTRHFTDAAKADDLKRPAFYALLLVLALGIYAEVRPDHAALFVKRILFLHNDPWPPDTTLVVTVPGFEWEEKADGVREFFVPEGAVIRVQIEAQGVIPPSLRITKRDLPSGEPITIEVGGRGDNPLFDYRFVRVARDFEFYVQGGDDDDTYPTYRVFVRTAPRIDELLVDYDYPDYINATGLEDRASVREYNVLAPIGTRVSLHFKVSAPLRNFSVLMDGDASTLQLEPEKDDPRSYSWSFVLDHDLLYSYKLTGENGAPSPEAPYFNISAQPDLPPEIGIIMPETGYVDVTTRATIPIAFRVHDDWRLGSVALRWDSDRDGAFLNRIVLSGEDLRTDEDGKTARAFHAFELSSIQILDDEQNLRPLRAGDTLFVRMEAQDTRTLTGDRGSSAPNQATYPSPIVLRVREGPEIERDLSRLQVRIREQVVRVESLLVETRAKLNLLVGGDSEVSAEASSDQAFRELVAAQSLVTSGLGEADRGFLRVFDGYLFNRLDPSGLTENLIEAVCRRHRTDEAPHGEIVATAAADISSGVNEEEAMGKLVRIMDLLHRTAHATAPKMDEALRSAGETRDPGERRAALAAAAPIEDDLVKSVRALLDRMEDWEDFQDLVRSLKDIIDLQKNLHERLKKAAR